MNKNSWGKCMTDLEKLNLAYYSLKQQIEFKPKIALVCGTGLGKLAELIEGFQNSENNEIQNLSKQIIENIKSHKK